MNVHKTVDVSARTLNSNVRLNTIIRDDPISRASSEALEARFVRVRYADIILNDVLIHIEIPTARSASQRVRFRHHSYKI